MQTRIKHTQYTNNTRFRFGLLTHTTYNQTFVCLMRNPDIYNLNHTYPHMHILALLPFEIVTKQN